MATLAEQLGFIPWLAMVKDFHEFWKTDFRFIFLPEILRTPAVWCALEDGTKILTSSHDQLIETADRKSNIKNFISSNTGEPIGMKLWEYIQFDTGYRIGYFPTSGRNLETGSWLFAVKPTMFWHHFPPESLKTHSETILSLSGIGGKGNADKNLFVLLNTVI